MIGQGIVPKQYHPVATNMSREELGQFLTGYRESITEFVSKMPSHEEFIKSYCAVTAL